MLLVTMIYTGTKALQYLAVPVFTIFKNLTIIAIAYGEVLWFGGSVSPLTLLSFGLMVFSSIIAAWADVQSAVASSLKQPDPSAAMSHLNAGYAWMALNIFCSAFYALGMRKVIKKMNFKDWDSEFSKCRGIVLMGSPLIGLCSHVLQQPPDDSRSSVLFPPHGGLVHGELLQELPPR